MDRSNTDCYFFYYSTCNKGEECPYRHCIQALGQKEVCQVWLKRRDCCKKNCPKRHMDTKRDRGSILCYYENKESGCMKPHCAYQHRKTRLQLNQAIERKDPSVILPLKDPKFINTAQDIVVSRPDGGLQPPGSILNLTTECDLETPTAVSHLIGQIVKDVDKLNVQPNNKEVRRQHDNQALSAAQNSSRALNIPPMTADTRNKKTKSGARSASCHGRRIREPPVNKNNTAFGSNLQISDNKQPVGQRKGTGTRPKVAANDAIRNGTLEGHEGRSNDIIWQYDSSERPLKPKKREKINGHSNHVDDNQPSLDVGGLNKNTPTKEKLPPNSGLGTRFGCSFTGKKE